MEAAAWDQPSKTAGGSLAGPRGSAQARLARSDSWQAWTHGLQRDHLNPPVGASCAGHWQWEPKITGPCNPLFSAASDRRKAGVVMMISKASPEGRPSEV